jgi:hypothetical protein
MKNDIKVLHVYYKKTDEHKYYGSLKVIFDEGIDIGISKDMLYKHDFIAPYVNDKVIIRQDFLIRAPKKVDM